jgi:hypothetical protein
MWEEANHCVAFEYVLETFPLNRDTVYDIHLEVPSMLAKEAFIMKYMKRMTEETLDITTTEGKKDFIRNLGSYQYCHGRHMVLFRLYGCTVIQAKEPAQEFRLND